MDAVLGEERVMGELVGRVREQDVDLVGAEFVLALPAHLLPMLQPAATEKAADG